MSKLNFEYKTTRVFKSGRSIALYYNLFIALHTSIFVQSGALLFYSYFIVYLIVTHIYIYIEKKKQ